MIPLTLALCLAAAPPTAASRQALASQLGDGPLELKYDGQGRVRLVRGKLGAPRGGVIPFLLERQAALALRTGEELAVLAEDQDERGGRHYRVGRSLKGVPVALDQLRVHLDAAGAATSLEAEVSDLSGFVYRPPTVPPQRARDLATGGYRGPTLDGPHTDLVIAGDRLDGVKAARLAWKVRTVYPAAPGQVPVGEEVYLDAHSGAVLARFSVVFTAGTPITVADTGLDKLTGAATRPVTLNATQYADGVALQDIATLAASGGQLITVDGRNSNTLYALRAAGSFGDPAAANVADFVRQAVKFNLDTFGWNKWNFNGAQAAAGGTLVAVTHEGTNLANAYFTTASSNGQTLGFMKFGDGDGQTILQTARCLDIAGHELGHGVVQGTAGLVYHNQSGALNEHFADVFGWLVDASNDTIGEGCTGPGLLDKPLRDLCNPGSVAQAQPADMAHYQDLADTDATDHGGVHVNSGIPNHAACLFRDALKVGSTNAAALATLGRIWFQALSRHLGATASFQDMVDATATSCTELALGATTCNALAAAWAGVGLGTSGGSGGGSCPPHSTESNGQCFCDQGYHVNAAGTGCEADQATTCPLNAHAVGTDCYCDAGYVPDPATGTSCVVSTSDAACGDHAHRQGTACVCDDCFQFEASRTGEGQVCVAVAGCAVCTDPLKVPVGGVCQCEPGTTPTATGCGPVVGQCGKENYAGRCEGSILVYCNDTAGTATQQIETIDCSKNAILNSCGLENTEGSYNCVRTGTTCQGGVTGNGLCVGSSAQICAEGTVKTYDCGTHGCGTFDYRGSPVQFCLPCPPHATADSAGTCHCDSGYTPNGAGDACVATGGACPPHATEDSSGVCRCDAGYSANATADACVPDGGGTGCGCGTTDPASAALLPLALLALHFINRRRTSWS